MAKMDAFHLKRLKEEQEKALIETDNQLEQWNRFRSDYVALGDRLKTLPNKTTHNVMVPFGSLAFIPGQLVHTNEILVLFGDNYFVERSAVQAVDIVTRRLKKLDENIQGLQKQREMLTPRAQFTSEMFQMASGKGDEQDIREEYNEEKERHWRERHREYLRQGGEREMKKAEKEDKNGRKVEKTDADYWDILDRLEQQEKQEDELDNLEEEEESSQAQQQSELAREDDRFAEDEEYSSSLDDSEETEEEEEEEDSSAKEEDEEEFEHSRQRIITFSHTKQQEDTSARDPAVESSKDKADIVINSPADLYRLMKTAPRSILKTPSKGMAASRSRRGVRSTQEEMEKKVTFGKGRSEGGRNARGVDVSVREKSHQAAEQFAESKERPPGKLSCAPCVQALTDTVVERPTTAGCGQQHGSSSSSSQPVSQPVSATPSSSSRPVSKFRAGRPKTGMVSDGSQEQLTDLCDSSAAVSQGGGGDVGSARPVSKFRASRMKQGGGS